MIRDTVGMAQVLDLYGYRPKRGMMPCPFHGERNPSLKVYTGTGGWHCFGCGRGGSVIDFVMEHERCTFREAVAAIDNALHLGLMNPRENPFEANRQKRLQDAMDDFVQAIYAYCDALRMKIEHDQLMDYRRMMKLEDLRHGQIEKITADDWTFLLSWKEEDEYNNYRIDRINEFREEVAAWRRKARRTN